MTISLLSILAVLTGLGFWFYYKNQKHKIKDISDQEVVEKEKRGLNDIDKMLSHITDNNGNYIQNKEDSSQKDEHVEQQESGNKKNEQDFHDKVLGSIILEKKKKK